MREATVHPRATENIPQIIEMVKTLEEKGYAYSTEYGDVYFRTNRFKEYGKLSHQPLDDLEAGARIQIGETKEDPMDFALWKGAKPGEPYWDSPWGKGRPGWHIECSTMAKRYLGETIDIHCGGQDLVFPHHENEIAQSECCNGVPFANYWMHNGYINVDNKKMSKSLNNFFTVREVAEKYGYEPIRYLMISSHYRSPINYSVEIIEQCKAALDRLYHCREDLEFLASVNFNCKCVLIGTADTSHLVAIAGRPTVGDITNDVIIHVNLSDPELIGALIEVESILGGSSCIQLHISGTVTTVQSIAAACTQIGTTVIVVLIFIRIGPM